MRNIKQMATNAFILGLFIALLLGCVNAKADNNKTLKLEAIFSDSMILQRDEPIVIWGEAPAGSTVKVSLIRDTKDTDITTTITDSNGYWKATLAPQKAGGTYQLEIENLHQTRLINDVLFGDVWLASGQSNMEWKLNWGTDNWEKEVANSHFPDIRYFEIENDVSLTPKTHIPTSGWKKATPEHTVNFSAVAWYFAKNLHLDKNVPIAIIDSTWGGTPAEAWTSLDTLQHVKGYKKNAADILNNEKKWQTFIDNNEHLKKLKEQLINSSLAYADKKILGHDFDDTAWTTVNLPNPENKPLSDIVWLRKSINLEVIPSEASVNFGELTQLAKVFINSTLVFDKSWNDPADQYIPLKDILTKGENTIVIRIVNDWNNKVYVGRAGRFSITTDNKKIDLAGDWKYTNSIEDKLPPVEKEYWLPGVLFNAMINPITAMPIKGVIWYQGENNVDTSDLYSELFKALIQDWRTQWQQPELPFLFVQLASFLAKQEQPIESELAELRAAQTSALSLPKTGMAVTVDIGNANDIHPRNKHDVGYRLWRAAKHVAYQDNTAYSGPVVDRVKPIKVDNINKVHISFKHAETGLSTKSDEILKGFALAGKNQQYVNALAKITKDGVVVYADTVSAPHYVRYGWADNTDANLYNAEQLPAVPFQAKINQ